MEAKTAAAVVVALLVVSTVAVHSAFAGARPAWVTVQFENSRNAYIFIKVLYPDGLHELYSGKVRWGVITLNLASVKRAWNGHYSRTGILAEPLILITLVKDGKASFHAISLNWDELPEKVVITPKYRVTGVKTGSEGAYQSLERSVQHNLSVALAGVISSGDSYGIIHMIKQPIPVGFSLYLLSENNWERLGYLYLTSDRGDSVEVPFTPNTTAIIGTRLTYRYERWKIIAGGFSFREEYLYVMGFDLKFRHGLGDVSEGTAVLPVEEWRLANRSVVGSYTSPYYSIEASPEKFGIPLGDFLEVLREEGVASTNSIETTKGKDITMEVNASWKGEPAFSLGIIAYGEVGKEYSIFAGYGRKPGSGWIPLLAFCLAEGADDCE
ncbi:hypothetical protein CDI07_04790 [Thermococcus sp. 5-4]|nr:hypothetical protein CDI07_04790 [Thermococcus sp. 5-4]